MKPNHRAPRSLQRAWIGLLVPLGVLLMAVGVTSQAQQDAQVPDEFFSQEVYPIFEQAQCRACHFEDGVASATRLHFPAPDASTEQVKAFGAGLGVLVDRDSPKSSLLLNKPTNRIQHTGGERIKPGSAEEKALLRWINHLTTVGKPQVPADSQARTEEKDESLPETPIRRLTHSQYNNTVRDLLGDGTLIANRFPSESYANGFKNQAVIQDISPMLAEVYNKAAETLARNAYRLGELEKRLPCRPSSASDQGCRDQFLQHFGSRAFRRPLTDAEMQRYRRIFDEVSADTGDFVQGAQMVVETMLQSPKFLFHLEADQEGQAYERASRLSYFLWNTMPDEALTRKAVGGKLDTVEGIEETARWMLEDPRARSALNEFFAEWLRFDEVLTAVRGKRQFPEFTPYLAATMVEETKRFLGDLVWNDKNFMEAFTADYGFLNADLASLYGVPPPAREFGRISLPPDGKRAGLLGQASFLTATSKPGETSPTARGIFVRAKFLCQHVPDPPPGVNTTLPEPSAAKPQTTRQRMLEHRENPTCASCHSLMDPIGFGLENYDPIGAWRDTQVYEFEVEGDRGEDEEKIVALEMDTTGTVAGLTQPGSSGPAKFSGAKELGQLLAESAVCQECIVKQLFRYAFGRPETPADRATIRNATSKFRESGFRLREVLVALVTSPQFLGGTHEQEKQQSTVIAAREQQ